MSQKEQNEAKEDEAKEGEVLKADELTIPNNGLLRSAFLAALKHKSDERVISAAAGKARAFEEFKSAMAGANLAYLEELRTIELLRDAGSVHKADKAKRDAKLLRAEQHLESMKHEAWMSEKEREAEKKYTQTIHDKFMNDEVDEDVVLNDDEEQFREFLKSKLKPSQYQAVADDLKKEMNLTKEQEKMLDEFVEELTKTAG